MTFTTQQFRDHSEGSIIGGAKVKICHLNIFSVTV